MQKVKLQLKIIRYIKKMKYNMHLIFILKIFSIFILVPIIGTLLHELGHYIVAISFGYEAQIHYSFTTSSIIPATEITPYFYFIVGGPLSTWIQCLIPFFILLFVYNKNHSKEILKNNFFHISFLLCLIFISMGGRFIFNLISYVISPSNTIDEIKMAVMLMIHPETFLISFAVISLVLLLISLYKIPKKIRLTFLLGALTGSAFGHYLWYFILGPILLP